MMQQIRLNLICKFECLIIIKSSQEHITIGTETRYVEFKHHIHISNRLNLDKWLSSPDEFNITFFLVLDEVEENMSVLFILG